MSAWDEFDVDSLYAGVLLFMMILVCMTFFFIAICISADSVIDLGSF